MTSAADIQTDAMRRSVKHCSRSIIILSVVYYCLTLVSNNNCIFFLYFGQKGSLCEKRGFIFALCFYIFYNVYREKLFVELVTRRIVSYQHIFVNDIPMLSPRHFSPFFLATRARHQSICL